MRDDDEGAGGGGEDEDEDEDDVDEDDDDVPRYSYLKKRLEKIFSYHTFFICFLLFIFT